MDEDKNRLILPVSSSLHQLILQECMRFLCKYEIAYLILQRINLNKVNPVYYAMAGILRSPLCNVRRKCRSVKSFKQMLTLCTARGVQIVIACTENQRDFRMSEARFVNTIKFPGVL